MSRFSFNKSSNPIMNDKALQKTILKSNAETSLDGHLVEDDQSYETMTVEGAVNKTFVLFAILLVTTFFSYQNPNMMLMYIGLFGGLGTLLFASFKPHTSPIAAPIYAALEGLFVGTVSSIYAASFDGIVFQALSLTMATLFMMLFIYKSGIIKVTDKLRTGIVMATGAIMLVYLVSIVGSFVGFTVPFLHDSGPLGIGISVVIIGVAAMNLLLDFDMFEKSAAYKAPKYMEWFCGLGLMVTLVWLYIEFLRLLSKLSSD